MTASNIDTLLADIAAGKWKLPLEKQLDRVYDVCNQLMKEERWHELDLWLKTYPTKCRDIDLLVGLLTASLPGKLKLPGRSILFDEIERELKLRGEWEEDLLKELE